MRRTVIAILLVVATNAPAYATPYDLYGAGARGGAMGAQTASADGPEGLHYNVSQLATAKLGVTFGLMATFGRAQVLLKDRPDGYHVPDIGLPSPALGDELILRERSDTDAEQPLAALTIGVVTPVIFEGLRAGFMIFLPMPTPVTLNTRFADERERYFSNQLAFERIGRKVHQLDLQFGIAYEVTSWLAVGVGASYLPGFGVNTGIYLADALDQTNADLTASIDTENGFGLLAGLTVELPADVSIGLSFRDAVALRLSTDNEIQLNGVTGGEPIQQVASWTPIFTPARAAVGVAWSPGDWTFSGDLRYTIWAAYEDAQSDRTGFANVFSGALGVEHQTSKSTTLRVGTAFEPSPVPPQTGRTNYVDNDRVRLAFGAGHAFEFGERKFDVAWYLGLQALLKRETFKASHGDYAACDEEVTTLCDEVPDDLIDPRTGQPFPEAQGLQTGNPGFPGWVSGGWVGMLGVELRY